MLINIFIKNINAISEEEKREKYGVFYGILGICLNLVLFAIKFFAGIITGAISITADAFNNLSDAGSSIITLLGFRLAAKKPDADHPFGHGRSEYISGFIISMLILLVGFELGKSSLEKIFSPEAVDFSVISIIILVISVIIKLYMAYYNYAVGKKINSSAMKATSTDSLTDSVSTTVVLVCMLVSYFTELQIDAYCGLAVSGFILFSGLRSAQETISPLLGQTPTPEFVAKIENTVKECSYVCGIHDLIVHDYGPGRRMISLHAEVPADSNLLEVHDAIDNIEKRLRDTLNCDAVIHMDPVQYGDSAVSETRETIQKMIKNIDERITIHDFRMVVGNTHTNLIFDAVIPYDIEISDKEIKGLISKNISDIDPAYRTVIEIDRPFIINIK
ncbi:MAG: cation transporter [Ruminococcaceae bacterium]|nr:cation transporter [Oscillospiraceae bacterium]